MRDARASGGTYAAPARAAPSTGDNEHAYGHGQDSVAPLQKESNKSQIKVTTKSSEKPAGLAAESSYTIPHEAADSMLKREEPLTTLSAFMSPAQGTVESSPTQHPVNSILVRSGILPLVCAIIQSSANATTIHSHSCRRSSQAC